MKNRIFIFSPCNNKTGNSDSLSKTESLLPAIPIPILHN